MHPLRSKIQRLYGVQMQTPDAWENVRMVLEGVSVPMLSEDPKEARERAEWLFKQNPTQSFRVVIYYASGYSEEKPAYGSGQIRGFDLRSQPDEG